MNSDDVLVLDSQSQRALSACRTLGKKGLSVTAGGHSRFLPAMLSKYSDDSFIHPDPLVDNRAFVDRLETHLADRDYVAVFPMNDETTNILSYNKDRLEATGTRVGAEDWETHQLANDKKRLYELVEELDVLVPETHAPTSMTDVERIDEERSYTVIIKPRRTTTENEDGSLSSNRISGTYYVAPEEDLVERYRSIIEGNASLEAEYPLVQEYVDGDRIKCTLGLAHEGELIAFFQLTWSREYPTSGGVGAIRQGVWEPKMKEYADRVVEALDWTGPVHVEFLQTRDGDYYLLEVNGRYWGSLPVTINSGVDIPWLHYQQLAGEVPAPRPPGYRTDVEQRNLFFKDVLWLREQLSRRNLSAIVPFTTSFFTTHEELMDPSDPLPFLGLGPRVARIAVRRLKRGSAYGVGGDGR